MRDGLAVCPFEARTHHDGSLSTVGQVEVAQLLKGVSVAADAGKCEHQYPQLSGEIQLKHSRAGDIRVEHKEGCVVLSEDVTSERQRTSCEMGLDIRTCSFEHRPCRTLLSPVPRGSVSIEKEIWVRRCAKNCMSSATVHTVCAGALGRRPSNLGQLIVAWGTDLDVKLLLYVSEKAAHDLGPVVDC